MKGLFGLILLFVIGSAQAALVDRGGGFIYDDVLDVTWLADANYAQTSGYDADGAMTWDTAVSWAGGLSVYDSVRDVTYDDWRLPTIVDTGTSGCNFAYVGTDCGYNLDTSTSEMASLFYDTLGNTPYFDTSGSGPQSGFGLTNTGPFTNFQTDDFYWSGTEYVPSTINAWMFSFATGAQGATSKDSAFYYALAVRDGDVVPIPAAVWLFASGLGLLGWMRRKQTA